MCLTDTPAVTSLAVGFGERRMTGENDTQPKGARLTPIGATQVCSEEEAAAIRLDDALLENGLANPEKRAGCLNRLLNLPGSLQLPMLARRGVIGMPPEGAVGEVLRQLSGDSKDYKDRQAQLLRLNPAATWQDLNRAEQMKARRLMHWVAESHPTNISTERKGRRAEIDSAVVLYLVFVLMEALGRDKFSYSTRDEARRGGPMLRALMAALQFHHVADHRAGQTQRGPTPDAVVTRIIKTSRSAEFRQEAERLALRLSAVGVAEAPGTFRHLVAQVMKQRRRTHRTD